MFSKYHIYFAPNLPQNCSIFTLFSIITFIFIPFYFFLFTLHTILLALSTHTPPTSHTPLIASLHLFIHPPTPKTHPLQFQSQPPPTLHLHSPFNYIPYALITTSIHPLYTHPHPLQIPHFPLLNLLHLTLFNSNNTSIPLFPHPFTLSPFRLHSYRPSTYTPTYRLDI